MENSRQIAGRGCAFFFPARLRVSCALKEAFTRERTEMNEFGSSSVTRFESGLVPRPRHMSAMTTIRTREFHFPESDFWTARGTSIVFTGGFMILC